MKRYYTFIRAVKEDGKVKMIKIENEKVLGEFDNMKDFHNSIKANNEVIKITNKKTNGTFPYLKISV